MLGLSLIRKLITFGLRLLTLRYTKLQKQC
jgi:hypothetical protein